MPYGMSADTPGLDGFYLPEASQITPQEDAISCWLETKRSNGNFVPQIGDSKT